MNEVTIGDARKSVVIVGRPNVGKSTLFNRFLGEQAAIVEDQPGVTRDRHTREVEWCGRYFNVVDTGGWMPGGNSLDSKVSRQVEAAAREADLVLFLVDATVGLSDDDEAIAAWLRTTGRPILLVANKVDGPRAETDLWQFLSLGLGDAVPVSAIHGRKSGDLLDAIVERLEIAADEPAADAGYVRDPQTKEPRVAIVGRPNVGKSSLLNAMLGEERDIVHEAPGTTRDAIDTVIEEARGRIVLIDTAGIRRRGRIERGIEKYSVLRALRAIDRADVVLLVMDGLDGVAAQDTHIAGYVREAYKGLVAVVNKWDLVRERARAEKLRGDTLTQEYTAVVREALNFMDYVPVLFLSAKTGQRVPQVLETALAVQAERGRRIATSELNQAVQDALARHAPPSERGRALKVYYTTQATTDPPTFVFFVNNPQLLHFSYERYLENQLRAAFGFSGTPIKLVFRQREK